MNSGTKKYRNVDEKKNSKKKRKGQGKRDAKSQKGKTWILEGTGKGIEEKLAIPVVADYLSSFYSRSYWSSSMTRTAARLCSGHDSPLLAGLMQFALHPHTVASNTSFT